MSFWFGYRVYFKGIDLSPGTEILAGPFDSYAAAKTDKKSIRGNDLQTSSVFPAENKEQAFVKLANENWMA